MKILFASLSLIFLVVNVQSLERIETFKRLIEVCAYKTDIDDASLQRITRGDFSVDNEKSRMFSACMFKMTKALTEDDAVDAEALAAFAHEDDRPAVRAAVKACNELHGEDDEAKVWNFLACYKKHRPEVLERLASELAA